jgi:hypothetical protein
MGVPAHQGIDTTCECRARQVPEVLREHDARCRGHSRVRRGTVGGGDSCVHCENRQLLSKIDRGRGPGACQTPSRPPA